MKTAAILFYISLPVLGILIWLWARRKVSLPPAKQVLGQPVFRLVKQGQSIILRLNRSDSTWQAALPPLSASELPVVTDYLQAAGSFALAVAIAGASAETQDSQWLEQWCLAEERVAGLGFQPLNIFNLVQLVKTGHYNCQEGQEIKLLSRVPDGGRPELYAPSLRAVIDAVSN